jgi:Glycosyl transferase family 2
MRLGAPRNRTPVISVRTGSRSDTKVTCPAFASFPAPNGTFFWNPCGRNAAGLRQSTVGGLIQASRRKRLRRGRALPKIFRSKEENYMPIGFVIATYNSERVLPACLNSIPRNYVIVDIDNASKVNSIEIVKSLGARIFVNEKNLGFGSACNQGAKLGPADRVC